MIFLDDITAIDPKMRFVMEDVRSLRIHPDVMSLATHLAIDEDKLRGAAPYVFMPAYRTWIEWEDQVGKMGFFFDGEARSVTNGFGMWASMKHDDAEPVLISSAFNVPGFELTFAPQLGIDPSRFERGFITEQQFTLDQRITVQQSLTTLKPMVWAVLALINSPKIIRRREVDVRRINKRRQALGRYTFHPHHEVRLNVDKRIIETVTGTGDGASRALHFVRTHLRFRLGQYELVSPHWRGDPALGIKDTHYAVDRQNSKWND
jgi:hypothetical protein